MPVWVDRPFLFLRISGTHFSSNCHLHVYCSLPENTICNDLDRTTLHKPYTHLMGKNCKMPFMVLILFGSPKSVITVVNISMESTVVNNSYKRVLLLVENGVI